MNLGGILRSLSSGPVHRDKKAMREVLNLDIGDKSGKSGKEEQISNESCFNTPCATSAFYTSENV